MNQNLSDIRTAFNNTAVLTDTARTITVTDIWTASQTFSGGFTIASGQSVVASGATVTGKPTFSQGLVITSGAAITATGVTVSGSATWAASQTFQGGITINNGLSDGESVRLQSTVNTWENDNNGGYLRWFTGVDEYLVLGSSTTRIFTPTTITGTLTVVGAATAVIGNVTSSTFRVSQTIYQNHSLTTTATASTILATFALPASALAVNGQQVRITAFGQAQGASCTFAVAFGATEVMGIAVASLGQFSTVILLSRTGATTQNANANAATGGVVSHTRTNPAETLANAINITFVARVVAGGTGTANIDSVLVEYLSS